MIPREQIARLEGLLERIRRNAAQPRAAREAAPKVSTVTLASAVSPGASWASESASAFESRESSAPEELDEDDLVEVTSQPPDAELEVVSASDDEPLVLEDEDEPPISSSRSKVVERFDQAMVDAAAGEDEHEIPIHTPPPESGPQEAAPPVTIEASRMPELSDFEADLRQPSLGPTTEQLGETIELEAPRGPSIEIDMRGSADPTPAPERPSEELEVMLPRPEMPSGLYDVSVDEVSVVPEELSVAPQQAPVAVEPSRDEIAPPAGDIVPERTARPELASAAVAHIVPARPERSESFVELLDASLALDA